MGSLILRLKGSAAHSLRRISAGINGARMMSTTTNSGVSDESPSKISSLPWLMLPPAFEGGGDMVFNFYKLAEKKVETNKMRYSSLELELPDDIKDVRVLGSSHGWLALFNSCNKDVFLLNPHSGRHIKLPPLSTLPVLECDLEYGDWTAFAVILSCSPDEDEQECRALMIFGAPYRLAFCWPRHSTEWTPIGALHYGDVTCYKNLQFEKPSKYVTSLHSDEDGKSYKVLRIDPSKLVRPYEKFGYSSRLKRFFCLTGGPGEDLERWDLRDPGSPRIDWMVKLEELEFDEENYPWPASSEEESTFKAECCRQLKYLVFADKSNELFLVTRHINMRMDSDGSYVKCIMFPNGAFDYSYPYKTIGFDVHKIDWEGKRLSYMEGSLDGLAMFIGMNDPFAIPACECEFGLEPDCIYFTDDYNVIPPKSLDTTYGGHDIGICKYETGKFSSCYYDYGDYQSIKRILPPPVWFTPLSKPAA